MTSHSENETANSVLDPTNHTDLCIIMEFSLARGSASFKGAVYRYCDEEKTATYLARAGIIISPVICAFERLEQFYRFLVYHRKMTGIDPTNPNLNEDFAGFCRNRIEKFVEDDSWGSIEGRDLYRDIDFPDVKDLLIALDQMMRDDSPSLMLAMLRAINAVFQCKNADEINLFRMFPEELHGSVLFDLHYQMEKYQHLCIPQIKSASKR